MDLGKRLKTIRESKSISIYKLSQDSEVSESHIRNLERGNKQAKVETLEILVKSLNISMSEFFNEDGAVTYPTEDEKAVLEYYRTLPNPTASAIKELCVKLKNQ